MFPVPSLQNEPTVGPTRACRQFSDFCLRLMEGATNGQQYEPAWSVLRAMFDASNVQLLRNVAPHSYGLAEGPSVHLLEQESAPEPLRRLLELGGSGHGLLAVARLGERRCDAVLVVRSSRSFTAADSAWMELVVAQLRPALELGHQLAWPTPTMASAVHLARLMPTPCALIDEAGRCVEQNAPFHRVIQGIPGAVRDGRVTFEDRFLQDSWQQALLQADRTTTTQSLLAATTTGEQWKIHVVPVTCVVSPVRSARSQLLFALFEKYNRTAAQPSALLASRPLTKAEIDVLSNLMLGHTAKAIARARGASVNTVRSQIATILAKTGHRTQKELIAHFSAT